MRIPEKLAGLGLAVLLAACGGGEGKTKVHISVDASALPSDQLAAIRDVCVTISGDKSPYASDLPVSAGSFSAGSFSFDYSPTNTSGVIVVMVCVKDASGTVLASSSESLELAPGKSLDLTIHLGAGSPDGGLGDGGAGDGGAPDSGGCGESFGGGDVTSNLTLTAACSPYNLSGDITVSGGATLTLEPGVVLRFPSAGLLTISDGALIANGTAVAPITLTSLSSPVAAGNWSGVSFLPATLASSLRQVVVEGAGQDTVSTHGCVTLLDAVPPGRVAMDHVTLRSCQGAGLSVGSGYQFTTFTTNSFGPGIVGPGIDAYPETVASLGSGHSFTGISFNQLERGTVNRTGTWHNLGVPWHSQGIAVEDATANPILTLEAGLSIGFDTASDLEVGFGGPGGLVVAGTSAAPVTLTSSSASPAAGDWYGVLLDNATLAGTSLANAVVEDCGQTGSLASGCITARQGLVAGRVSLDHLTVRRSAQDGIDEEDESSRIAITNSSFSAIDAAHHAIVAYPESIGAIGAGNSYGGAHIRITGGSLHTSATWANPGTPFDVDSDLDVSDETTMPTLTLSPGTTLRFFNAAALTVGFVGAGKLVAIGSAGAPIVFTSAQATPTKGDWQGLYFDNQTLAGSRLSFVTVSYGGQTGSIEQGDITVGTTTPLTIDNALIDSSAQFGIAATGSSVTPIIRATVSYGTGATANTQGNTTCQNLGTVCPVM